MTIIVASNMEAAGREQGHTPAQPCATRDSAQINPTCVSGETHPHGIAGVRELVTVRIRVGSGRAHRCIYPVLETPQLARIQFQSAHASRAVTAGASSVTSAPLRPFQFFGAFTALRAVFSIGIAGVHLRQKSPRRIANRLQVLSLSARVLGLAAGVVGQHTDRRKMKCPTKALKDSTK